MGRYIIWITQPFNRWQQSTIPRLRLLQALNIFYIDCPFPLMHFKRQKFNIAFLQVKRKRFISVWKHHWKQLEPQVVCICVIWFVGLHFWAMSEESFPNIEICFRETYIYSLNYKGWFFLFYINWYPQRSVRSPETVVPGGCAGIKYRSSGIAACALYWGTISPAPLFLVYGSRALLFSLGWPQAQDLPSQPPKWWGHKEFYY